MLLIDAIKKKDLLYGKSVFGKSRTRNKTNIILLKLCHLKKKGDSSLSRKSPLQDFSKITTIYNEFS